MGFGDIVIRAYYCYTYQQVLYVRGRVLREDYVIAKPQDRWLRNFINMIKRLMSYELPSQELEISLELSIKMLILFLNKIWPKHLILNLKDLIMINTASLQYVAG